MNKRLAIFFDQHGLLRSGWRASLFLLAFVFVSVIAGVVAVGALNAVGITPSRGSAAFLAITSVLSLSCALLIGWLCGRNLERLPFRALGASFTKGWLSHLVLGCLAGAATLSFAVVIAMAFGGLRFEFYGSADSPAIIQSLAVSFAVFAAAAAFEEALFRGYILQTFSRSGLTWLAILLTSLFFGAVHLNNPDVTALSTVNTILAGLWFSAAYLRTRDLWFVWGMHLMWNWMQGSIFGIEVSGLTSISSSPLLKEIDGGPAWLTGTTYGIEGGIVCTVALIASTAAIYFLPIAKPDPELLAMTSSRPATPPVS